MMENEYKAAWNHASLRSLADGEPQSDWSYRFRASPPFFKTERGPWNIPTTWILASVALRRSTGARKNVRAA